MALLLTNIANLYGFLETDAGVKDWYILNSIFLPSAIEIGYLWFVLVAGPRWMQNRKPYNIKSLVIVYNVVQIIFNAYLCREIHYYTTVIYISENMHQIECFEIEHRETKAGIKSRILIWNFAINKLFDLLDSVFFVLTKKQSLVTFLHVYHHTFTFGIYWYAAKHFPGGPFVTLGVLNSFVHSVLYTYYLLTLFSRTRRLTQFFKKSLTQLQISHMVIFSLHSANAFIRKDCNFPRPLFYFGSSQALLLIGLFLNFYIRAYLKHGSRQIDSIKSNGVSTDGDCNKKTM